MKDELDLKLNWNIVWFHPNNTCCSVTQDNFLELIKSNS